MVRGYQRGYRWGRPEVQRLLEDIQASEGATYYLQPIVVKRLGEDRWELVDGQQRLTTLLLILQFIKQTALPSAEALYSLEYETRPRSAEFLRAPNADGAADNIDFFHIYQAWQCIEEWFEEQGAGKVLAAINLYKALSERVKVIWYGAPENVSSTDLFTRLNVGKIPLTDAELVKALVLSRSQGLVAQTDRAQAMAAEWDMIERDLRTPELGPFSRETRDLKQHTLAFCLTRSPVVRGDASDRHSTHLRHCVSKSWTTRMNFGTELSISTHWCSAGGVCCRSG